MCEALVSGVSSSRSSLRSVSYWSKCTGFRDKYTRVSAEPTEYTTGNIACMALQGRDVCMCMHVQSRLAKIEAIERSEQLRGLVVLSHWKQAYSCVVITEERGGRVEEYAYVS